MKSWQLGLVAAGLALAPAVQAAYTFTEIARAGGMSDDGFTLGPLDITVSGVNAAGQIALKDRPFGSDNLSVFVGDGTSLRRVHHDTGVSFIRGPAIDAAGGVAFFKNHSNPGPNPPGVYVVNPAGTATLVHQANSIGNGLDLNAGGQVAFVGDVSLGSSTASAPFVGSAASPAAPLALPAGVGLLLSPVTTQASEVQINASGAVALVGSDQATGTSGVYVAPAGGAFGKVLDLGTNGFFGTQIYDLSFNDLGHFAFVGAVPGTLPTGSLRAVYLYRDGALEVVATDEGDFRDFFNLALNNQGELIFQATLDSQPSQFTLFGGGDPVADRLLGPGDVITVLGRDGEVLEGEVGSFAFGGLNDAGQLALSLSLDITNDGSFGASFFAVRADPAPVPLPAAAWLLGSGLAGLIVASRRRKGAVT